MSVSLETMLFELGREVDVPPAPDVSRVVAERLRSAPTLPSRRRVSLRRAQALGLAAAVGLGAVVVLAAPVRRAVADLFGAPGIGISTVEELPPVPSRAEGLRLGERTTTQVVPTLVDYEVQVPSELGDPDEVYLDESPAGGAVSFVYHAVPGLQETNHRGIGALLTQFVGTVDPGFAHKLIDADDTSVDIDEIAGNPAYFISGGDHVVFLIDADGTPRTSEARLAGNTLIWEQDGLTFRLEANVGLRRALEIGRSLADL